MNASKFLFDEQHRLGVPNLQEIDPHKFFHELGSIVKNFYDLGLPGGNGVAFNSKRFSEGRGYHGYDHARRVANMVSEILSKCHFLSREEVTIGVVYAFFHDACRADDGDDGTDYWDKESAALTTSFLVNQGYSLEKLIPIMKMVAGKDHVEPVQQSDSEEEKKAKCIALAIDAADSMDVVRLSKPMALLGSFRTYSVSRGIWYTVEGPFSKIAKMGVHEISLKDMFGIFVDNFTYLVWDSSTADFFKERPTIPETVKIICQPDACSEILVKMFEEQISSDIARLEIITDDDEMNQKLGWPLDPEGLSADFRAERRRLSEIFKSSNESLALALHIE